MPRRARVVIPNLPHHITQRGVRRQDVFFCDDDREVYLRLLKENAVKHGVAIIAYTLMTNHVHHLVAPSSPRALSLTYQITHKRYADYINARHQWTGHLWQSRFYSSPVDSDFFWIAVRYILQNPLKAGMVRHPTEYRWSSARHHCLGDLNSIITADPAWTERLGKRTDWMSWLEIIEDKEKVSALRENTLRDLPTGSSNFLDELERDFFVVAHPPKIGRPKVGKS